MPTLEWMHDHSDPFGFADINCPGDLVYAEFVLSESYSLNKFVKEAKEQGIPLETAIKKHFKEWKDANGLV